MDFSRSEAWDQVSVFSSEGGGGEYTKYLVEREKERPFGNFSHPVLKGLIFFVCKTAKRSPRNVTLLLALTAGRAEAARVFSFPLYFMSMYIFCSPLDQNK